MAEACWWVLDSTHNMCERCWGWGRRGDRLKSLVWERDGFVLWYKRLEAGVFKLPRMSEGARSIELRASELAMILDGIDVSKLKRVPRYERTARSSEERIRKEKNSAEKITM